jgi:uncharacterized protein
MRLLDRLVKPLVGLLGLAILCQVGAYWIAEQQWFQHLGYLQVFWVQLQIRLALGGVALICCGGFLAGNLVLAAKLRTPKPATGEATGRRGLRFRWFFPLVLGLSVLLLLLLYHTGQGALQFWQQPLNQDLVTQEFLNQFNLRSLLQEGLRVAPSPSHLLLSLGLITGLLVYPLPVTAAIALGLSLQLSLILIGHWTTVLKFLSPSPLGQTEPLFAQDIGFYLFSLPFWELLQFQLLALGLASFLGVGLIYLLSADSLSQGYFPGLNRAQKRHLQGLAGLLLLAIALGYWLNRYQLLYAHRGVVFGAGYTDTHLTLPLLTVLAAIAFGLGLGLLILSLFRPSKSFFSLMADRWGWLGLAGFVLGAELCLLSLPATLQTLKVLPNELQTELPYLQRNIEFTRRGFGLDGIRARPFDPQPNLSAARIQANDPTIRNIRLWDSRPLLETNQQLQQLRPYYRFAQAFIDRYRLKTDRQSSELRQLFLAARELDFGAVPASAQTWINRHFVYTHGYGFTVSPVNIAGEGGLPEYFVKDIGGFKQGGRLITSSPEIAASIPIDRPRIYYGQLTRPYIFAPSQIQELDYPSGDKNAYNTYDGTGGVKLNSPWLRLAFGIYLRDWRLLLTPNLTAESRIHFRRQIQDRVKAIAPFLHLDSQPYLVVAAPRSSPPKVGNSKLPPDPSSLFWIMDAYTTSRHYPYSEPSSQSFNYLRNSVKVVVDAYHGTVSFYVLDPQDPILKTWQRIFPGLFQPLAAMPEFLAPHLRYPVDLFEIQSDRLLKYHMTDPVVFYNQEDQWQIPTEIYGNQPQPVTPYYLIMKLPGEAQEEFVLLHPFTPLNRPNLIAWFAARSDGKNYGKLLLYQFPKQKLVFGPEQMEARINQDPSISQQISLWSRAGSQLIQGNLLVIPIDQSLLYVEPFYLKSEQNSLPTLIRVVALYQNQIVMAETLDQALAKIFLPVTPPQPSPDSPSPGYRPVPSRPAEPLPNSQEL